MRTLLVFPTTDRVDEWLAGQLAPGTHGLSSAPAGRAITLRRLEEELARAASAGRRRLTGIGRSLALSRVLAETALPPFESVKEKPGFRRAFERFWNELAVGACTPDALHAAAGKLAGLLAEKARALADAARAYLALLEENGLQDESIALGEACRALEAGAPLPEALADVGLVRIEDVVDWPPSRLGVVRALAVALSRRGGKVQVVLPLADRAELNEVVDPAWQALEGLSAGVELVARRLVVPAPAQVSAFDAANAEGEGREVLRRVRALLDEGVPASRIVVAAKGIAESATALQRLGELADVPLRHRRGRPLSDAAVARLAVELARLSGRTAQTRARVEAIGGSFLVDLRGWCEDAPHPSVLTAHLREARVRDRSLGRDGVDGFTSRLERLAKSHEHRGDEASGAAVRRSMRACAAFFAQLDAWPAEAPLRRHSRELMRVLHGLRVPDRLRRQAFGAPLPGPSTPGPLDRAQAAALAHEQHTWTKVPELLHSLVEGAVACGLADVPVSRAAFARWLAELLAAESARPGSARGVAVELLELADLAGRKFDHLFVLGVHDGRLPSRPENDPLLSEDDRWRLNAALGRAVFRVAPRGSERSPFPSRQLLDGLVFALGVEAGRDVTLSRPRADARGRPLPHSPLAALAPAGHETHVGLVPLDPAQLAKRDAAIEARRAAAASRTRFFAEGAASVHAGDASEAAEVLRALLPGTAERPLSAATLERAANCAFRHLAETVLGAKAPAEDGEEAGPLESGRLAHLAAEHAVRAILAARQWNVGDAEAAVRTGLAAATAALDEAEPHTVLGSPELWELQREKILARLARMLQLEIARTGEAGLVPLALEMPFGKAEHAIPSVRLGDVHLHGKIDRVDAGPAGTQVVDYKSGASKAVAQKLRDKALLVTQFQLPIYVAAAKELPAQAAGADALYVSLRDGGATKTLLAAAQVSWEEMSARLSEALADIMGRLARADFAPRPHDCTGCHLRPVCRIPRPEASR